MKISYPHRPQWFWCFPVLISILFVEESPWLLISEPLWRFAEHRASAQSDSGVTRTPVDPEAITAITKYFIRRFALEVVSAWIIRCFKLIRWIYTSRIVKTGHEYTEYRYQNQFNFNGNQIFSKGTWNAFRVPSGVVPSQPPRTIFPEIFETGSSSDFSTPPTAWDWVNRSHSYHGNYFSSSFNRKTAEGILALY